MSQDVYAKITDRIVAALKAGVVPWHQPWNAAEGASRNLLSGKPTKCTYLTGQSYIRGGL